MKKTTPPSAYLSPHAALHLPAPAATESLKFIDDADIDQLRIEFMRISPSFSLASDLANRRRSEKVVTGLVSQLYTENLDTAEQRGLAKRTEKLTKAQEAELLQRFKKIASTREQYGDIFREYADWYLDVGHSMFDHSYSRQGVRRLGTLKEPRVKNGDVAVFQNSTRFMKAVIESDEFPPMLMLGIPLNLPDREIIKQVRSHLEFQRWTSSIEIKKRIRKPLAAKRVWVKPIATKLKLLYCRAMYPDESLWQLGLRAEVSETYCSQLRDPTTRQRDIPGIRKYLAALTNRALRSAQYMAEHASYDSFPKQDKILTPYYDWEQIRENIKRSYPKLAL